MFGESSGLADITLIIEDVRIPVISDLLAFTSPVFRAMLNGDGMKKEQNEIQLPEKRLESFIPFLRCIYPDLKDRITEINAEIILPLASEYQVVKLMEQCEDRLIVLIEDESNHNMSCEHLCKFLKLAEHCNRERLRELCTVRVSTFPLDVRTHQIATYKISLQTELQIAKLACQSHEAEVERLNKCNASIESELTTAKSEWKRHEAEAERLKIHHDKLINFPKRY
ncbi:uncharacterized protein LOC127873444 isoform X2 [Dreissena polymorpha]|nr:uncharacterized protein LOC127873444 isoform X2 [Dreissena polymorpha]